MKNAHKIFDGSEQTMEKILAGELRRLSKQMDNVAGMLARCGINGCKTRETELRGAAKMARFWAKCILTPNASVERRAEGASDSN